jgi:predicted lipoprotein with Yx(FWY)xxD motif
MDLMSTVRRGARFAGIIAGGALALAACGGSSSGGQAGVNAGAGGSSSGAAATVMTQSGANGTYLTDAAGRTLYMFGKDSNGKSACTGSCAGEWPPYTTSGSPQASGSAKSAQLSASTRSDGSTQVTYAGHPLYYFAEDQAAGDMKGQGLNSFGGHWTAVTPAGTAFGASSGGSTSTPTSGGYSYSY